MTITVKPDTKKLVMRYADDKDYWRRIGKTGKVARVTITSLFGTQLGKFELTGQSGNGGGGTTTDTELYYLHTDHLATIHAITDIDQTIVWQGEHDAFGQTYATIEQIDNPLRFPGQYFDTETGLHYNWHRYYNPATGRYISSDPIGLAGGLNTFGYVGQNPLSFVDPDGQDMVNMITGFGDGVSNNYTRYLRDWLDITGNIDPNSLDYQLGHLLGEIWPTSRGQQCLSGITKGVKKDAKERIKTTDVTASGSRKPNYELDKTRPQFEEHLTNSGFDQRTINTPKGPISIFSKNGRKEFTTRDFSRSTDGPSGELFRDGKLEAKIRFREK